MTACGGGAGSGETETDIITIKAIPGVTVPATGEIPGTSVDSTQYSGTVTWYPSVSGTFAASTIYTATITLAAKTGYTFAGVSSNFFTVAGADSVTNSANSGVVTASFPETDPVGAILRYYWTNERGELVSAIPDTGTKLSKTSADTMVVTASDDASYTNHRWYINGEEDVSSTGQTTYTFSSSIREVRDYILTLVVEIDGDYHNITFDIQVVE